MAIIAKLPTVQETAESSQTEHTGSQLASGPASVQNINTPMWVSCLGLGLGYGRANRLPLLRPALAAKRLFPFYCLLLLSVLNSYNIGILNTQNWITDHIFSQKLPKKSCDMT